MLYLYNMPTKFIISSPSASGKTTLVNALLDAFPTMYRLKTCTTRPVRPEEKGDEYFFLSKQQADEKIKHDDFVEYSNVYGNIYGLDKMEVEKNASVNTVVILDVQGTEKAKKLYPNMKTIFIQPPPREILEARLRERNTNDVDVNARLAEIDTELSYMKKYDYVVQYGSLTQMKRSLYRFVRFYVENQA